MAKGAEAKSHVIERISKAFGDDYIGEFEKKVYVWSTENGERIQVALALTCPKVPVGTENQSNLQNFDSSMASTSEGATTTAFQPAEFSDSERRTVEELMAALGL